MTHTITSVHSTDGTEIAYETHGDGPGVILIDGAMCFRDSGPMRPICTQLNDDFTVLMYDRRGRGHSADAGGLAVDPQKGGEPPAVDSASRDSAVQSELDDLEALVAAIEDTAASAHSAPALVGMSSGAALALRGAARLGDRIRSVVVYEPPFMSEALAGGAGQYTAELARALASDDRDAAVSLFLGRVGMPADAIAGMRQSPAWQGMTAIAPTLAYDDALMGDSRVPAELIATIEVPVLALAGGASPDMLQFGAREVAPCARDGAFDVLPEQGHAVDPGVFAARIRDFLRR